MVAGGRTNRLDPALIQKFPEPFDFRSDIMVPTASDTFLTNLQTSLRSYEMLDAIEREAPTLQEVSNDNPGATGAEVMQAVEAVIVSRQKAFNIAAPKLAACISRKSLTLSEINQINRWSTTGAAVQLYDWILTNLDLSIGKPQDLIRAQYASLQVAPTDSMATVSKKINLKWWLYVQHTMFDHTADAGQREGLRQIFVMLMSGPTFIAQEATFLLTTVENIHRLHGRGGWSDVASLQRLQREQLPPHLLGRAERRGHVLRVPLGAGADRAARRRRRDAVPTFFVPTFYAKGQRQHAAGEGGGRTHPIELCGRTHPTPSSGKTRGTIPMARHTKSWCSSQRSRRRSSTCGGSRRSPTACSS